MKPYKRHIITEERNDYCPYYPYSSDYIDLEEYREKESLILELDGEGLDWYSDEYLPGLKRDQVINELLDIDEPPSFELLSPISDIKYLPSQRYRYRYMYI